LLGSRKHVRVTEDIGCEPVLDTGCGKQDADSSPNTTGVAETRHLDFGTDNGSGKRLRNRNGAIEVNRRDWIPTAMGRAILKRTAPGMSGPDGEDTGCWIRVGDRSPVRELLQDSIRRDGDNREDEGKGNSDDQNGGVYLKGSRACRMTMPYALMSRAPLYR
jgi:hypothetical protein